MHEQTVYFDMIFRYLTYFNKLCLAQVDDAVTYFLPNLKILGGC